MIILTYLYVVYVIAAPLTPSAPTFAYHALSTLGCVSRTSGYWIHGIQVSTMIWSYFYSYAFKKPTFIFTDMVCWKDLLSLGFQNFNGIHPTVFEKTSRCLSPSETLLSNHIIIIVVHGFKWNINFNLCQCDSL